MKLRHLATLAAVSGALALPASSSAAAVPPGPGPVFFCGATVHDCVEWAQQFFTVSCGPALQPVCAILPSKPWAFAHRLRAVRSHAAACLFALRAPTAGGETLFRARVDAVRALYGPLVTGEDVRWSEALGLGVGAMALGGPLPVAGDWLAVWGERARPVLGAGDAQLRDLRDMAAVVELDGERARPATGAAGPVALYRCGEAFATHAAAAAILAGERPRLDAAALPELLALGFNGGTRTHVAGVEAVASATVVDIDRDGVHERSYWPPAERWAPPDGDPVVHAEDALLGSLARRMGGCEAPWLGLTAGLDSRVVAVALRELGAGVAAFTWGSPGWPEVDEAARVAGALGFEHAVLEGGWLEEEEAFELIGREAGWSEGLGSFPLFGVPQWPEGIDAYVTGGAGETGRAFYHRLISDVRDWHPESEIAGAGEPALDQVERAGREWLAEASSAGHRGLNALDVLYGEQRYRRWARSMLPRRPFPVVSAFADPEVQRALASLPEPDAFHRTFLAAHAPALLPPPAPGPRRGVPRVLRRAAARARRAPRATWPMAHLWPRRPRLRTWIADDALRRPFLAEAMGAPWSAQLRERFLADDARATEQALQVAGLAAFEDALSPAPTPRSPPGRRP